MRSKVSVVRCDTYESAKVYAAVKKSVELIGGFTAFIKPGSKVLVKPNLLMAKEPEYAVDTHPEVVRAVIKLLKEYNCDITVGDGPSVWGNQIENVEQVYELSGIRRVCEEEGVKLVEFVKRRMRNKFPLTTILDECDFLISVAKFKTHSFTTLTAAIKNNFGLVSGTYKTELHKKYFEKEEFAKILVDVYEETKPALTIVDGITAMEGEGPATGGIVRKLGLVFAGSDCVALDSVLALIMGLKPLDIPTTKEAALRNLGVAELKDIEVLGEPLKDIIGEPFKLPKTSSSSKIPEPVKKLARKLIRYYPCVERDNCVRCAACIDACPNKVITMAKKGIVFDYSKCIACFCCSEACPASAIKVKKSLLARLIGL